MTASRSVILVVGLTLIILACSHDKNRANSVDHPTTTSSTTVAADVTSAAPTSARPPTTTSAVRSTTTRALTTTTSPPITSTPRTAPSPTTSPTPTTTRTGSASAALAAQGLLAAWQAGDRTAAARYAGPAAVRAMFRIAREPVQAVPCQPDGAAVSCPYFTKGGSTFFLRVSGSRASGYRVIDVTSSGD